MSVVVVVVVFCLFVCCCCFSIAQCSESQVNDRLDFICLSLVSQEVSHIVRLSPDASKQHGEGRWVLNDGKVVGLYLRKRALVD